VEAVGTHRERQQREEGAKIQGTREEESRQVGGRVEEMAGGRLLVAGGRVVLRREGILVDRGREEGR
jgi:hypothetical protein